MKKFSLALLALATALAISPAAQADSFTFTFTGLNVVPASLTITGVFTATSVGGGLYDVTSLSGTFVDTNTIGTQPVTTFIPSAGTSADGLWIYDNLFCPSGTCPGFSGSVIDTAAGLLFDVGGNYEINIWGNGGNSYTVGEAVLTGPTSGYYIEYNKTAQLSYFPSNPLEATPEPGSLLLLGTGLLGLAFVLFRRHMPSNVV